MNNFETISAAFEKAGIDAKNAEYSITEYSLNTDLSFRFENLDDFISFLGLSLPGDEEKIQVVNSAVVDAKIDPDKYFYVNFYKPKIAEL